MPKKTREELATTNSRNKIITNSRSSGSRYGMCVKTRPNSVTRYPFSILNFVVVVFTLKNRSDLSVEYLLCHTRQGKEKYFRGHEITQNKLQRNKTIQRKSQHSQKNM